jgi:hypothetical protein
MHPMPKSNSAQAFREVIHLWQRLRSRSTREEQHGDRNSMQDPSQHVPTVFKTRTKNEFDHKADDHPNEHPEPARQPAIRLK